MLTWAAWPGTLEPRTTSWPCRIILRGGGIELTHGASLLIAADINRERPAVLRGSFSTLTQERGKRLLTFNPALIEEYRNP